LFVLRARKRKRKDEPRVAHGLGPDVSLVGSSVRPRETSLSARVGGVGRDGSGGGEGSLMGGGGL
jgi:hypothetical protein